MSNKINDQAELNWRPPYVALETSKGKLVIQLHWDSAPNTCRNFATLAQRKYYDNTPIHRIVPNKIIQAGDPTGTGKGGESIFGGYFKDEIDTNLKHNGAGVVAMANAGPDLNKSQFYITLATLQSQDNKATIFGRVIAGLEVLERISRIKTDKYRFPLENLKIERAEVLNSLETCGGGGETGDGGNDEDDDESIDEDTDRPSYFSIS